MTLSGVGSNAPVGNEGAVDVEAVLILALYVDGLDTGGATLL